MSDRPSFWFDLLPTPVGELVIIADQTGRLRAVNWPKASQSATDLVREWKQKLGVIENKPDPCGFTTALRGYISGNFSVIDQLPVASPGTAFQRSVWSLLREIPCGTTISYGELARRLGKPAAMRAVGLANGANPVGIVVPCHRVIGANGSLTGYGGGMERKRWLLAHERAFQQSALSL